MLRQQLRRKESDRFISGRSLSRNKQIEQYLINDMILNSNKVSISNVMSILAYQVNNCSLKAI